MHSIHLTLQVPENLAPPSREQSEATAERRTSLQTIDAEEYLLMKGRERTRSYSLDAAMYHHVAKQAEAEGMIMRPSSPARPLSPRHCPKIKQKKDNENKKDDLYPNCDVNVWLRSCEKEIIEPIHGEITGEIPVWLQGTLLRNGPGSLKVGDMTFNHLFDASALLHRFGISNGDVTYQCRFLQTHTFKRNMAAQRIVVTDFGTKAVPDPCQSIFQRVAAMFTPGESISDNAMISVYPFGDEYYAFTESPIIHRLDPRTLETMERVNLSQHVGIVNHTSHPHVMGDDSVYNIGLSLSATGPRYTVIHFPAPVKPEDTNAGHVFERAKVVGSVPARWGFHPSYMHTFGITENFFVIVEQPLSVSVPALVRNTLQNDPMIASLRWYPEEMSQIYLISREDGKCKHTFVAEAFFYLHIINSFEERGHCVLDICCYRDPAMLDCMYIESMKNLQSNPDYASMFRGRPLRFVMPLESHGNEDPEEDLLCGGEALPWSTKAEAHRMPDGNIFVKPERLCDLGCETPRINYERHLGRPYRYFYAISSDVDLENPGTIIKVDTWKQTRQIWCEKYAYPSEPIFVPSPDPQSEDDGVVLCAMVWGKPHPEDQVALLVLDARTWTELGRANFRTGGPVPKCLHGWFTDTVV